MGTFSIPFDTIYREGRIEGTFRLTTPTFNFGYDHSHQIYNRNNRRNRENRIFEDDEDENVPIPVNTGFFGAVTCLFNTATSICGIKPILPTNNLRNNNVDTEGNNVFMIHKDTQVS